MMKAETENKCLRRKIKLLKENKNDGNNENCDFDIDLNKLCLKVFTCK